MSEKDNMSRFSDGDPAGVSHEQYTGPYDPADYDDSEETLSGKDDEELSNVKIPDEIELPDDATDE